MRLIITILLSFISFFSYSQISFFKEVKKGMEIPFSDLKKIKVGNIWYFNGKDNRGSELWKSDGTIQGTSIVKDINIGEGSTNFHEMVSIGNTLYFTASFTNDFTTRLYKSDGTPNGTVEILTADGSNNFAPSLLTASADKVFFRGVHNSAFGIWFTDGQTAQLAVSQDIYHNLAQNLTVSNNKLFFTTNSLWVTDGTTNGTIELGSPTSTYTPRFPTCITEFQGKVYFFAKYYDSQYLMKEALFVSDGTLSGTQIIKSFDATINQILTPVLLQFLEKTSDKLYFRTLVFANNDYQSINLWTSDGTTEGTILLKNIAFSRYSDLKFQNIDNKLYIFGGNNEYNGTMSIWLTDGTSENTKRIMSRNATFPKLLFPRKFNNKIYFSAFDNDSGQELWTTDGTENGTYLVGEVLSGTLNSEVSHLMEFDANLLFWANDGNSESLWQYVPQICEGNRNYTIQSGSWNDASTWSCGRVPSPNDIVLIKNPHSVSIPDNYQTQIKIISTEQGSVLSIPKSSVIIIKPN